MERCLPKIYVLSPVPLTIAFIVLGTGFGRFVDGIFQLLQVHEMLSNKIPATDYMGKSVNIFWDGIFHAVCLIVSIKGAVLLWKLMLGKNVDRSGKLFMAGMLFGRSIRTEKEASKINYSCFGFLIVPKIIS